MAEVVAILSEEVATGLTTTTDKAVRFARLALRACLLLQPQKSHPYQCAKTIGIMLSFNFSDYHIVRSCP